MDLYKRGAGHFTGNEESLPYTRMGISYKDTDTNSVICKAELYFSFAYCTTCCCTHGLNLVDKSLSLTFANETYPGLQSKVKQFCVAWFSTLDPIVGVVFGFFRTTFNTKRKMDQCV